MLEIILLTLVLLLAAKRTPSRKRSFNLRAVRTTASVTVGNLVTITAVTAAVFGNADGAYRIMSMKATWSMTNNTAGDGTLICGYAHGDYTVAEIKEFIESGASISIGNKIAGEQAGRLIRIVGAFPGQDVEEVLNDGRPIKTRLNWAIPIGTNFNAFVYNDDGAQRTTGGGVRVNGTGWVRDY